jgi:hypothetical protein
MNPSETNPITTISYASEKLVLNCIILSIILGERCKIKYMFVVLLELYFACKE